MPRPHRASAAKVISKNHLVRSKTFLRGFAARRVMPPWRAQIRAEDSRAGSGPKLYEAQLDRLRLSLTFSCKSPFDFPILCFNCVEFNGLHELYGAP